jgi:hypothetical protein
MGDERGSNYVIAEFGACASVLLLCANLAIGQTTGVGDAVLQNRAVISPMAVDDVLYANQFPGEDIGQKVNNAIAACLPVKLPQCEIRLPAGTFSLKTTMTVGSPGVSIVGAGMSATILNYTGSTQALSIKTNTVAPAGRFAGFTIQGNPHASGVAIQVSDTVGARFEDIHIWAFDQPGAIGILFYDQSMWTERTQVSHVNIEYTTTAVAFKVIGHNDSFGYNRFLDLALTVGPGQAGIDAYGGVLYNSTLTMTCNIDVHSAAVGGCLVIEPGANWTENVYQITGEGPMTPQLIGIHVKAGGHLGGVGVVDVVYTRLLNDNPPGHTPTFRIMPGSSADTTVLDGGTIANFLGTRNKVTVYPQLAIHGADADFGFLGGTDVASPYVAMEAEPNNSFMIYSYGKNAAPNQLTPLARFDTAGNLHLMGSVRTGGADYAEFVKVRKDRRAYEPGDVLAVSDSDDGELQLPSARYSTRVAGIYSSRPGILGGENGVNGEQPVGAVPLAIHGIVQCKVSAENGAVQPGDLLVTAGRPGYAMKGTRRDAMLGAIVGKALGKLDRGVGVIPVLVTLQ